MAEDVLKPAGYRRLSEPAWIRVSCPKCGAGPGDRCVDVRSTGGSSGIPHPERDAAGVARDHVCPCCQQPVTEAEYRRVMNLLECAAQTVEGGQEWCRTCGGPTGAERGFMPDLLPPHARPLCPACTAAPAKS